MKIVKTPAGRSRKKPARTYAYPYEYRLRVVRLHLEEGYSRPLLAEQFGISTHSIQRWVKAYREHGADGLHPKPRSGGSGRRVAPEIRQRILDVKTSQPQYGPRRIADVLKRFFFLRTSPSTAHRTLAARGMTQKRRSKPVKNPSKPRFFERARPNQMWQSDIMTFRLAGRNAYLIGYLDDYSRYITALGLYRSQTAEHVLETYRRAVAEYGVPREMLTDNGRQYTNWRGKTRFEREMKKDRVKHIRSRPHHPMTLGKIERFWKSILAEFLQRAQFDSFEDAVARCAVWVKYYNHKRPHQGIGGLCPADRFFEIAHELRKTLEQGIEENALELALRGRPADPFYMVGRMGGQSVVIRAEKGKVKMLVDGNDPARQKELVYDARKDISDEDNPAYPQSIRPAAEDHGRIGAVDRKTQPGAALPANVHQPDPVGPVAEPGHRGDALGAGAQDGRAVACAEPAVDAADRKEAGRPEREAGKAAQEHPEDPESQRRIAGKGPDGKTADGAAKRPDEGRADHEGALRDHDGPGGGQPSGGLSQDLLQVGTAGPFSAARWGCGPSCGTPAESGRWAPAGAGAPACRGAAPVRPAGAQDGAKGCAHGPEDRDRQRPGEKKMSASNGCFR